jgi:hypothetical protein
MLALDHHELLRLQIFSCDSPASADAGAALAAVVLIRIPAKPAAKSVTAITIRTHVPFDGIGIFGTTA